MAEWRKYTYVPPGGPRRGPGHELIVRDCDPNGYAPPVELDGRGVSRDAAAWVLRRWRKRRRGVGAGLWVTRYGYPRAGER